MSIDFSNASFLSFSETNVGFDENSYIFKKQTDLTITGFLLDLTNSNGVEQNLKSSELFLESLLEDEQDIIINSENFGKGYIKDFSVEGEFIRDAVYKVSFIIYKSLDLSKIRISGGGAELNFNNQNEINKKDLQQLESLSEDISFDFTGGSLSVKHSVESSFSQEKSIINNDYSLWSNIQVQKNILKNLENRGKNSIKITGGSSITFGERVVSNLSIGEEYILSVEYLGVNDQNSNKQNLIQINNGSGVVQKNIDKPGVKTVSFTASSSNITIKLSSQANRSSFYKNIRLYNKKNTPLERSRSISKLLFNSNPIYSTLENKYKDILPKSSLWIQDLEEESFDEINFNHTASKNIFLNPVLGYNLNSFVTPTPGQENFSLKRNTNLNFSEEGVYSISESSEIKLLENLSKENLEKIIKNICDGAKERCNNKLVNYSNYFRYGCSSQTPTPISNKFLKFISKDIIKNDFDKTASISLVFSNDSSIESKDYRHEDLTTINKINKNFEITQSGNIRGLEGEPSERFSKAKNFFYNSVTDNIPNKISQAKDNILIIEPNINTVFHEKSKATSFKEFDGSIDYSFTYSNNESEKESDNKIIKRYVINTVESEATLKHNEFIIGCSSVAQVLNKLNNPKSRKISVSAQGFEGQSIKNIYEEILKIIEEKNFLNGEDVYEISKNLSFSRVETSLSLNIEAVDLSECISIEPTPIPSGDFGSIYDPAKIIRPTPTPVSQFSDNIPFTPYPRTPVPYDRNYYTPTITKTI